MPKRHKLNAIAAGAQLMPVGALHNFFVPERSDADVIGSDADIFGSDAEPIGKEFLDGIAPRDLLADSDADKSPEDMLAMESKENNESTIGHKSAGSQAEECMGGYQECLESCIEAPAAWDHEIDVPAAQTTTDPFHE